jgi:hypothetical protein
MAATMTMDGLEVDGHPAKISLSLFDRPVSVARGVAMPSRFVAWLDLGDELQARLACEVIDGSLRCIELILSGPVGVGGREARLPIQRWLDSLGAHVGLAVRSSAPGFVAMSPPTDAGDIAMVRDAVTVHRRSVDNNLLQRFADAYDVGGIIGAMAALSISEATAYRYLKRARAAGIVAKKEKK